MATMKKHKAVAHKCGCNKPSKQATAKGHSPAKNPNKKTHASHEGETVPVSMKPAFARR